MTPKMSRRSTRNFRQAASLAALSIAVATPFGAKAQEALQTAPAKDQGPPAIAASASSSPQDVVVTGSHIKGGIVTGHVLEITRKDIEEGGFSTVQGALESLPLNFGGGVNLETSNFSSGGRDLAGQNTGGASSANLHGLGPTATLVLLDGARLAPKGDGASVDLSLVPLSIVGRIEVLADGASAIYGADAIAGVVNIITRHDFEGMESRFRLGEAQDGKPDYQFSQLGGLNWAGGNLEVDYEHDIQGNLSSQYRSVTRVPSLPQYIFPQQQTDSVYFNAVQNIYGGWSGYLEGLYSERDFHQLYGVQGGGLGREYNQNWNTSENLIFGIRNGDIHGWSVELFGTYGHSKVNEDQTNTPDLIAQGYDAFVSGRQIEETASAEMRASGTLFILPGGPVKSALGLSYRSEQASAYVSNNPANIPFSRDLYSASGELSIPLVGPNNEMPWLKRADASAAIRYDHYSDFGGTWNPRIGMSVTPADGVKVRGSYSTSFRAPEAFEETLQGVDAFIYNANDTQSPTGTTTAIYVNGSNSKLKPETATNITLGLDYKPAAFPGLSISIDYYNILYKNKIVMPDPDAMGFTDLQAQTVQGLVIRNPTAAQVAALRSAATEFYNDTGDPSLDPATLDPSRIGAITEATYQNEARVRTDGIDLSASFEHHTTAGIFRPSVEIAYILHDDERSGPGQPSISLLNTIYNPVGFKGRFGVSWRNAGWDAATFINYVNSYTDNTIAMALRPISSWTTVDAHISYAFNDHLALFGNGHSVIALNASNLLGQQPPHTAPNGFGGYMYDSTNSSAVGRVLSVELTKRW